MSKAIAIFILITTCIIIASCGERNRTSDKASPASDTSGPQVPDGYIVEVAASAGLLDFPMFSTLDEWGRLFVFESTGNVYEKNEDAIKNPQFRIKLLEDTTGDGVYDRATVFADKLSFPQGGIFYKGSLYASSAPDLLKLTDTDGDNVADKREVILTGFTLNVNANSLVGPVMAPDGWLYMNSAIMGFDVITKEGIRLKGETSRTWRLKPDGSALEWISAGGMNNPVELAFTESSEPIGTETYFTDPQAGERDALVYWVEGGVYPKPNDNITRDKLVRTGELMPVVSKYSRVAPSGIGRYRSTVFGDDFKDNLFTAQFNTHRVLRHKIFRDGASFRTEDEIFFWNHKEDFHPTDVLEDADGSLLIVETGGWFIQGCPLSQVSKPELKGSIYRVRKKGVPKIEDPYGNSINWKSIDENALGAYLEDERAFVADRATQILIDRGNASIQSLSSIIDKSKFTDARTKAVFALYRIGTPESMAKVRNAVPDKDIQVAIAAARCAGLYKDNNAVTSLINLLGKSSAPVRRQAATALGQIGDRRAVRPLLEAAAGNSDRFINHSIIYSLIKLDDPDQVRPGLSHASPQVKEAALIALDQMTLSPLKVADITSFLADNNQQLQRTALWIVSHHPEWSREMTTYLQSRFRDTSVTADERKLFTDVLVSFAGDAYMQQFIAAQMREINKAGQLMLLDAMSKSQVKKFPVVWTGVLARLLVPSSDAEVKSKVIELIGLRGISSLRNNLNQLSGDNNTPASLRMQALGAIVNKKNNLNDPQFNFLYQQLTVGKEAVLRQQAASVLERSKLNEVQLKKLANEYLPKADAFTIHRLIPVFEGQYSAEIGRAVATTLTMSPALDGFSEERINKLFEKYPSSIKSSVDSLKMKLKQARAERLQRLQEFEAVMDNGVLDRGRALFFGKATCSTCHTIGPKGGNMGPDLTSIQRDRSVHDLLEAIVYPSASFVREFETYTVKTTSGSHTGIIRSRTPAAIVLATSPQSSIRIPSEEIISTDVNEVSMMPQGLDKLMTKEEMADLMVFIIGQDQDPETDARILRHTSSNK